MLKRFKLGVILGICIMCFACVTTANITVPDNCKDSIFWNKIPHYKAVGSGLSIAVFELVKHKVITKDFALNTLEQIRQVVSIQEITYSNFIMQVSSLTSWMKSDLSWVDTGSEILILASPITEEFGSVNLKISQCDRDIILKWIETTKNNLALLLK